MLLEVVNVLTQKSNDCCSAGNCNHGAWWTSPCRILCAHVLQNLDCTDVKTRAAATIARFKSALKRLES